MRYNLSMAIGEFIIDRWMEGMIASICTELDIDHQVFSYGWVHRLEKGDVRKFVCGYRFDLNAAASAGIANDKVAAYEVLQSQGVPAAEHFLVRKSPVSGAITWYGTPPDDMVVKPLDASGGLQIARVKTQGEAEEWIDTFSDFAWAVSPFYDIKRECRIVMLDGEILLAYEKAGVVKDGLTFFNLGQGATATDITPNDTMHSLAYGAMDAIGLRLAAVDVIETADGEWRVLEVNSGFMMEHYMRQSDENRQKGYELYQKIITRMMGE